MADQWTVLSLVYCGVISLARLLCKSSPEGTFVLFIPAALRLSFHSTACSSFCPMFSIRLLWMVFASSRRLMEVCPSHIHVIAVKTWIAYDGLVWQLPALSKWLLATLIEPGLKLAFDHYQDEMSPTLPYYTFHEWLRMYALSVPGLLTECWLR